MPHLYSICPLPFYSTPWHFQSIIKKRMDAINWKIATTISANDPIAATINPSTGIIENTNIAALIANEITIQVTYQLHTLWQ